MMDNEQRFMEAWDDFIAHRVLEQTVEAVAEEYQVPIQELVSRTHRHGQARHLAFFYLATGHNMTHAEIADFMNRERSTVSYGIRTLKRQMRVEPRLRIAMAMLSHDFRVPTIKNIRSEK